ncbi:MAG TPA: methylated-DNA--[protein]-cysteine S-methyltransferase [Solirubrobacteraceae bacterium]|nr:methylated-DNA--[protein]-cysteine S-methyltransferase [Solirubrobacteraceae bacterium]
MTTTHTIMASPIGELTLVGVDGALRAVYFPGHWTGPDPATFGERSGGGFEAVQEQLAEYFAGERTTFELATSRVGDGFQRKVWGLIERIPYGETTTYGDLARELGDVALARAVGGAVGHNPLSIIVACHRVLGRDGKLTGYAGGLDRKRFLLELEAPQTARELATPSLF